MNETIRNKIFEQVTKIITDEGILKPNQTLKIVISIENIESVIVETVEHPDTTDFIRRAIDRMTRYGTRMLNIVDRENIKLSTIIEKHLSDMLKYRNAGRLTLLEFSKALRHEGISCKWMDELELDDLQINDRSLDLSTRTVNALHHYNIMNARQLRRLKSRQILQIKNLGKKGRREIYGKLLTKGLDLGWDDLI